MAIILGLYFLTSKEWVRRYSILSEIKDLFSSIASSEDKMPTMAQKTKLEAMIYDIQRILLWQGWTSIVAQT